MRKMLFVFAQLPLPYSRTLKRISTNAAVTNLRLNSKSSDRLAVFSISVALDPAAPSANNCRRLLATLSAGSKAENNQREWYHQEESIPSSFQIPCRRNAKNPSTYLDQIHLFQIMKFQRFPAKRHAQSSNRNRINRHVRPAARGRKTMPAQTFITHSTRKHHITAQATWSEPARWEPCDDVDLRLTR